MNLTILPHYELILFVSCLPYSRFSLRKETYSYSSGHLFLQLTNCKEKFKQVIYNTLSLCKLYNCPLKNTYYE